MKMRQENREKEGRRGLSLEGVPEEAGADREQGQGEPSFEQREAMQLENIVRSGAVITRRGDLCIHTVTVIGQIEGHYQLGDGQKSTKYEHLIPMLVAAENSEAIDGLLILLNTIGGDVEAGLAIAELIAGMKTPTVSLVLGGGHSIGVPLAVSADRSFIAPSATMTLHPVRSNGLVLGVYQSFAYFHRMQERILRFVESHSKISRERMQELMLKTDQIPTDMGSILDGEQAVAEGLIDKVGGIAQALDELEGLIRGRKEG